MALFASKTRRDLNHDPTPWEVDEDGGFTAYGSREDAVRDGFAPRWEPDPEFDHVQHNKPNPILVAFRRDADEMKRERGWTVAMTALSWDRDAFDSFVDLYDPAVLGHASRVLTRLASLAA